EEKSRLQMLAALRQFRDRFELPFTDDQLADVPFYRPPPDSLALKYMKARRAALGGPQPFRNNEFVPCQPPERKSFERQYQAMPLSMAMSTTKAWVNLMTQLCRDTNVGKLLVPIV